ncbi:MAG: hypothetical protein JEY96_16755 [Bacteroidales bacterium]|nr:hypothetical protein [Bacteroidales bacterium]
MKKHNYLILLLVLLFIQCNSGKKTESLDNNEKKVEENITKVKENQTVKETISDTVFLIKCKNHYDTLYTKKFVSKVGEELLMTQISYIDSQKVLSFDSIFETKSHKYNRHYESYDARTEVKIYENDSILFSYTFNPIQRKIDENKVLDLNDIFYFGHMYSLYYFDRNDNTIVIRSHGTNDYYVFDITGKLIYIGEVRDANTTFDVNLNLNAIITNFELYDIEKRESFSFNKLSRYPLLKHILLNNENLLLIFNENEDKENTYSIVSKELEVINKGTLRICDYRTEVFNEIYDGRILMFSNKEDKLQIIDNKFPFDSKTISIDDIKEYDDNFSYHKSYGFDCEDMLTSQIIYMDTLNNEFRRSKYSRPGD